MSRPRGPQDDGWYADSAAPRFAHFYQYLPTSHREPVFVSLCHVASWQARGGLVLADLRVPSCRRCVQLQARDLMTYPGYDVGSTRLLLEIPNEVPAGFEIVVHNTGRRSARTRPGLGKFRAWPARRKAKYIPCDCGWAPELGVHYRVDREAIRSTTGGRP